MSFESDLLDHACQSVQITLTREQNAGMLEHWQLLSAWNQQTNLTAITKFEDAAYLHYADSLAAMPYLPQQGPWIDIGSGGGFPGIVLAIMLPHMKITLLEARRKKASFLSTAAARLKLQNVRVLCQRAEENPQAIYEAVVTRATFSNIDTLKSTMQWLKPGGQLFAYQGPNNALSASDNRWEYTVQNTQRVLCSWICR